MSEEEVDWDDDPMQDADDERDLEEEGSPERAPSDGDAFEDDQQDAAIIQADEEDEEIQDDHAPVAPPVPQAAPAPGPDSPDPFADPDDDDWISDSEFTDNSPVLSEDDRDLAPGGRATVTQLLHAAVDQLKERDKRLVLRYVERRERDETLHRHWKDKYSGRFTKEKVQQSLRVDLDDPLWTEDDEEALRAEVVQEPLHAYLCHTFRFPRANNQYRQMWAKMVGLKSCLPTDVIAARHFLEYAATPTIKLGPAGDRREYPDPGWTTRFCQQLKRLVLAPYPHSGNVAGVVALLVQWSVACRLNDRRAIPIANPFADRFMNRLQRVLASNNGARSLPTLHKEVRYYYREVRPEVGVPWYSHVLRGIEKLQYDDATPPLRTEVGRGFVDFAPYPVETADLTAALRALGSYTENGIPVLASLGDHAHTHEKVRVYKATYPDSLKDFHYVLSRANLADRRFLARNRKLAARADQEASQQADAEGHLGEVPPDVGGGGGDGDDPFWVDDEPFAPAGVGSDDDDEGDALADDSPQRAPPADPPAPVPAFDYPGRAAREARMAGVAAAAEAPEPPVDFEPLTTYPDPYWLYKATQGRNKVRMRAVDPGWPLPHALALDEGAFAAGPPPDDLGEQANESAHPVLDLPPGATVRGSATSFEKSVGVTDNRRFNLTAGFFRRQ